MDNQNQISKGDSINFECNTHKMKIRYIYMSYKGDSKLACLQCCREYRLDKKCLIEIAGFGMNKLLPDLKCQQSEQLAEDIFVESRSDELKQEINSQFELFSSNIQDALEKQKQKLLSQVDKIEHSKLDCAEKLNEISQKKEIINMIISNQNNQNELNSYLKNLINQKNTSKKKDQKKIKNILKEHMILVEQYDFKHINTKLNGILELATQKNLFKKEQQLQQQQQQKEKEQKQEKQQQELVELKVDQEKQIQDEEEKMHILEEEQKQTETKDGNQTNRIFEKQIISKQITFKNQQKLYEYPYLNQHKQIQIDFSHQKIGIKEVIKISSQLSQCENLTQLTLNLKQTNLSYSELEYITEALKNKDKITQLKLDVSMNSLQEQSLELISTILKSSKQINSFSLNLSHVKSITNVSFNQFCNTLIMKRSLTKLHLNLERTNMKDQLLIKLAQTIQSLKKIKILQLDLGYNCITDDGFDYLNKIIHVSLKLDKLELDFQGNKLGDKSVESFILYLPNSVHLKQLTLKLKQNTISNDAKESINEFNENIKDKLNKLTSSLITY